MKKLHYRKVLPYLINKHKNADNPVGDLCRDVLEDMYGVELTTPEWFFEYIKGKCCDLCYQNALEPLRRAYNRMVLEEECKVYINDGEYRYKCYTESCDDYLKNFYSKVLLHNNYLMDLKESDPRFVMKYKKDKDCERGYISVFTQDLCDVMFFDDETSVDNGDFVHYTEWRDINDEYEVDMLHRFMVNRFPVDETTANNIISALQTITYLFHGRN